MKKILFLLFAMIFTATSLIAQSRDVRSVAPFNKIKAGSSFDVFIRKGNEEKVVIEAQSGDIDKILTRVDGKTLTISVENSWWGDSFNFRGVKVFVTFRELEEVAASGSGSVRIESPLTANDLRLSSSGSGSLYCEKDLSSRGSIRISNSGSGSCKIQASIATQGEVRMTNSGSGSMMLEEINANQLKIENSGSGSVKINGGNVNSQSIVMSGSGGLHMGQSSATCNIRKSGSGSIRVDVREELSGNSSGSGNIYLTGRPRFNMDISGSGKIRHTNN